MLSRILLAVTATSLVACGTKPAKNASDIKQLTLQDLRCDEYTDAEIDTNLQLLPAKVMAPETWRPVDLRRARNAMAGLPASYLKFFGELNEFNDFTISQGNLDSGVAGVTNADSEGPINVVIAKFAAAADIAVQHEVGHAVHFAIQNRPGFDSGIQALFQAQRNNSSILGYSRTSHLEYFAEAFNSYYCSKDAHAFVKENVPATYDFLRKQIPKPRWETEDVKLSTDLFLSLGGSTDAPEIGLSSPTELNNIGICLGSRADCIASKKIDFGFNFAGAPAGRNLFKSKAGLTLSGGQIVTILGFDGAGALKAARAVKFETR